MEGTVKNHDTDARPVLGNIALPVRCVMTGVVVVVVRSITSTAVFVPVGMATAAFATSAAVATAISAAIRHGV